MVLMNCNFQGKLCKCTGMILVFFSKLPRPPLWARNEATKYSIQWLNYTYPNSVFLSLGKEISPFFYLVFDMFWCGVPSLPPIYYYSKIYHFFLVSFSPFTCSNLFTVLPFEMYKHCGYGNIEKWWHTFWWLCDEWHLHYYHIRYIPYFNDQYFVILLCQYIYN